MGGGMMAVDLVTKVKSGNKKIIHLKKKQTLIKLKKLLVLNQALKKLESDPKKQKKD